MVLEQRRRAKLGECVLHRRPALGRILRQHAQNRRLESGRAIAPLIANWWNGGRSVWLCMTTNCEPVNGGWPVNISYATIPSEY